MYVRNYKEDMDLKNKNAEKLPTVLRNVHRIIHLQGIFLTWSNHNLQLILFLLYCCLIFYASYSIVANCQYLLLTAIVVAFVICVKYLIVPLNANVKWHFNIWF